MDNLVENNMPLVKTCKPGKENNILLVKTCKPGEKKNIVVLPKERQIIRSLAEKYLELSKQPVMEERKKLWKSVNSLESVRPVILVETHTLVDEYIPANELQCENAFLRNVEKYLKSTIRHAEEIGDDTVIEPYFRLAWEVDKLNYGVNIETRSAIDVAGGHLGHTFSFPLTCSEDVKKLRKSRKVVNTQKTLQLKFILEDIMGDILPVRLGNTDQTVFDSGFRPWTGRNFIGLTMDLFKLCGNDRLLYWVYDAPETIHKIMAFLRDERIEFFRWMQQEGLLDINADNQMAGPRAYGYVKGLPGPGFKKKVTLDKVWCWAESQETTLFSPSMFNEFFLPYIAEVASLFGLVYYGCCERVDDRLDYIEKAIPNLRTISVSGWNDFNVIGDMISKKYVYSRKPIPAYISGATPDWDLLKEDMKKTITSAKNCHLQIVFRDIYTINHDFSRIRKWVDMAKSMLGL